jgi:hypothetical protein
MIIAYSLLNAFSACLPEKNELHNLKKRACTPCEEHVVALGVSLPSPGESSTVHDTAREK